MTLRRIDVVLADRVDDVVGPPRDRGEVPRRGRRIGRVGRPRAGEDDQEYGGPCEDERREDGTWYLLPRRARSSRA